MTKRVYNTAHCCSVISMYVITPLMEEDTRIDTVGDQVLATTTWQ